MAWDGSTLDLTVVQAFPGHACSDVNGRDGGREVGKEISWAATDMAVRARHGMSWGVVGGGKQKKGGRLIAMRVCEMAE